MYTGSVGHHAIDLVYLFMTLLDRFPDERMKKASKEFARRWIRFASGKAPWRLYTREEQSICVVNSYMGWFDRTRREDEAMSPQSVEGERRYQAWETMDGVLRKLGVHARLDAVAGMKMDVLGTLLLESLN